MLLFLLWFFCDVASILVVLLCVVIEYACFGVLRFVLLCFVIEYGCFSVFCFVVCVVIEYGFSGMLWCCCVL